MMFGYVACAFAVMSCCVWAVDQRNVDRLREELEKGTTIDELFELFKITFDKVYRDPVEESYRREIFHSSVISIRKNNELYKNRQTSYSMGINQFADMTIDEMPNCEFSEDPKSSRMTRRPKRQVSSNLDVPEYKNWKEEGYVRPVEQQGKCGSCCSFASVGAIEAQLFKTTGKSITLSKQQLVDCKFRCNGTVAYKVYGYVREIGGLMTAKDYPYRDITRLYGQPSDCEDNPSKFVPGTGNLIYEVLNMGVSQDVIMRKVASIGPVVASIRVNDDFKNLKEGVFNDTDCIKSSRGHAVLIVGYGTDNEGPYWLVKNSWDTTWGKDGYCQISRNGNICGIRNRIITMEMEGEDGDEGGIGGSTNHVPSRFALAVLICLSALLF